MRTASTNKKVREIINMVKDGGLLPQPEFQRRLVWSQSDKNHFLDSVLRGYPFPEIYLADGEVNTETGRGTQLLVDGLQRVSTLIQYFEGDDTLKLTTVPSYKSLEEEDRRAFLQYDVAVRDLGSIDKHAIVEVFRRLNATKYSLLDIEVNNAVYAGALKRFAETFSQHRFFEDNRVFNSLDYKRMGDLRFALGIVCTMIAGYFNRDDGLEDLLSRYNDEFPLEQELNERIERVISFLSECAFPLGARIWKKADLFTSFVELDTHLNLSGAPIAPIDVVERLGEFFSRIETGSVSMGTLEGFYYKAALQASNDRLNRVRRGIVVGGILAGRSEELIVSELLHEKLADPSLYQFHMRL